MILEKSIILKFKDSVLNKLSDSEYFIIRCLKNLNHPFINNIYEIKRTKVNFELFVMIIHEAVILYQNYIDDTFKKEDILRDLIARNIDIIESKKYYYHKFVDQLEQENFKGYIIKIDKILNLVLQGYTRDTEFITFDNLLYIFKDFNIIPDIISQYKLSVMFSTFNLISTISNINIKTNSPTNPIMFNFFKEFRQFRINKTCFIELLFMVAYEYYNLNFEVVDGENFYNLISEIFLYDKSKNKILVKNINNKWFRQQRKKSNDFINY